MIDDDQIDKDTFLGWVADRYKAFLKGKEKGFNQKFTCPRCSNGRMMFDEKKEIYFCSHTGCLKGSLKSLKIH